MKMLLLGVVVAVGFLVWKLRPQSSEHLMVSCHILDQEGAILRAYPGLFCDYFSNGDYVVSDGTQLQYFDKNDQVVWTKALHVHHQVKVSSDEERILFLSSDFEKQDDKRWNRWDHLFILNRHGEIVASASLKDLLPQLAKTQPQVVNGEFEESDWVQNFFEAHAWELFHTNSIYEIETSEFSADLPWQKKGNVIIDLHRQGEIIAVLDPSLKTVLYTQSLDKVFGRPSNTHDAQILPNSNLLVYVNKTKLASGYSPSSLAEIDLKSGKIVWQYEAKPPESFRSPLRGGVTQLANGNYLFNDETTGAGRMIWINRQGDILKTLAVPFLDPETKLPAVVQEVKTKSLTSFLKNSHH